MSPTAWVVVTSLVLVVAVISVFYYGQRVKQRMDARPVPFSGGPVVVAVTPESAERLAAMSSQPIFIKQTPDGVRIQLDNRPLVPLAMLADGATVKALREVVVAGSQRFGAVWSAVASLGDDGSVSIQRLT